MTRNAIVPGSLDGTPQTRRGALLLLVLSVLTLFMMIGSLMLVLAMRARSTARAFADAVAGTGFRATEAHDLLDEALMTLIRGSVPSNPAAGGTIPLESLLADRYGLGTQECRVTRITPKGPLLEVTVDGIAGKPLELQGRILTIKPEESDVAPVASFRILSVTGSTFQVANLRTVSLKPLPTVLPCQGFVNGRAFAGTALNESWDAFDLENMFLTQASSQGSTIQVQRPAFAALAGPAAGGGAAQPNVDNDGDGTPDGIWLDNVLPNPVSGSSVRVSYLVLDLCGRLNANAHGSIAGNPGSGPAAVDGSSVLPDGSAWNRLLAGGQSPTQSQPPTAGNRRPVPALGRPLQGRFGGGPTDTYAQRLDYDGPRLASPQAATGNLFTCGELEALLRPFDSDATSLPPRLVSLLNDTAEVSRMLVTTDSWDTCGLVGAVARSVETRGDPATLPIATAEGLRLNLGRALDNDDDKEAFVTDLVAAIGAAGVSNGQATAQWVANLVDFIDTDTTATAVTLPDGTSVQGVEPSTIVQDGQPVFQNWDQGRLASVGELLGVPSGTRPEIDERVKNGAPLTSLAASQPEILDLATVASPFETTVFVDAGGRRFCRWREPGRVNLNAAGDDLWRAVSGSNAANPFGPSATAQMSSNLLLSAPGIFAGPDRDVRTLDRTLTNRVANIGTTRSDVFAVWVTLELAPPQSGSEPEYHRLFAIVDRSIPVGHAPGQNLNARDTIRVLRHLE